MTNEVPWSFECGEAPLDAAEQQLLAPDLERLGANATSLAILNASLEVRSRHSRLRVLRAYRDERLAGAVFFMECRKTGECYFEPPLSRFVDLPGMPSFVWGRYGIATDSFANPGFVAPGTTRETLVAAAIEALRARYMHGSVVDFEGTSTIPGAASPAACHPAFDCGMIDVEGFDSVERYLGLRKTLRKKMNAFRNKGGTVELIRGALGEVERGHIVALYATMQHRLLIPYQDIFAPLVGRVAAIDDTNMVHIVTRLDAEIVGYHSFYMAGGVLHCLSGGFDRSRSSTYHAYENLIVESVRFCLEHGLARIDYGPVLNETKVKMMTAFRTLEARVYVRYGLMKRPMALLLERSVLKSERIGRFRGLQPGAPTAGTPAPRAGSA